MGRESQSDVNSGIVEQELMTRLWSAISISIGHGKERGHPYGAHAPSPSAGLEQLVR